MSAVISRAIAAKTQVSAVVHGTLSQISWLSDAPLTEAILFETIPYENSIGVAELTADEIRAIIDEQLKHRKSYVFNGIWGINVVIDPAQQRTVSVLLGDSPDAADGRVSVAFNSWVIAGGGGRFPILRRILRRSATRLRDTELQTRDIVRDSMTNLG